MHVEWNPISENNSTVTEPTDDFAAMFEASIKAKRFEKGQTLEGRIVAIGPDVAFVDVGGKGEATIDINELAKGVPLISRCMRETSEGQRPWLVRAVCFAALRAADRYPAP